LFAKGCTGAYLYGFQGQEMDDEVNGNGNSYTTMFRQYDPRLGRWLSLDPLMANFPWQSPYAAFDNNPIVLNDPSGLAAGGEDPPATHTIQKDETLWGIAKNHFDKYGYEEGDWDAYWKDVWQWNKDLEYGKIGTSVFLMNPDDIPVNEPFTVTKDEFVQETYYTTRKVTKKKSFFAMPVMVGAYTSSGVLLADDVTVVGIADDIAIPFIFAGAITYTLFQDRTITTTESVRRTRTVSKKIQKPSPFYYVTYIKVNSKTGKVYVGRSSGYGPPKGIVKIRDANHHMKASDGWGKAQLVHHLAATKTGGFKSRLLDPSYWAIRGSEQLQIEYYRLLKISGNTREGIGPGNKKLSKYLKAARKNWKF